MQISSVMNEKHRIWFYWAYRFPLYVVKKSTKIGNASALATPRGFATHGRVAPTGPQSAETIARQFREDEVAYMTEPKWPYWGKPDTQKTEIGHERGSQGSDFDTDWCNPALRFEPGLILQVPERKNGFQIQSEIPQTLLMSYFLILVSPDVTQKPNLRRTVKNTEKIEKIENSDDIYIYIYFFSKISFFSLDNIKFENQRYKFLVI